MKKLLVLLLISALAIFVFAGCDGFTPAEGEGEGEGEIEEVTVEIEGAVEVDGKTYVSAGNHEIVVTFPAPVSGTVKANVSECSGYYGTGDKKIPYEYSGDVVLFPNEDKTVWTGSGYFGLLKPLNGRDKQDLGYFYDCCASYVRVYAGECDPDVCVEFPVIVDSEPPYAEIVIAADGEDCVCEDCDITFDISVDPQDCVADVECCGDDCSGLANWAISVFDEDPFDVCCEVPCAEPAYTCSGTECPITCSTGCIEVTDGDDYWVVVSLADEAGNDVEYYATIEIDSDCSITVMEYNANVNINGIASCTDWTGGWEADTNEDGYVIGVCGNDID
jgi:hypothetical protein